MTRAGGGHGSANWALCSSPEIDDPERLDRLTTTGNETVITATGTTVTRAGGGIVSGLFIATALMIVSRVRQPLVVRLARELTRFGTRVGA